MVRIVALLMLTSLSCQKEPQKPTEPTPQVSSTAAEFSSLRLVDGLWVGGQIKRSDYEVAAQRKVHTVVNLRGESEMDVAEHRKWAEAKGLVYIHLPIAGSEDFSRENVQRLDQVLVQNKGELIVHCGSGNRVGAMLALRQAWLKGDSSDNAIQYGKNAGMTTLTSKIQELLQE